MVFRYYIQLNAVKGPDASGPAYYNMSMANISLSPQCFGLGVDNVNVGDCWRHDLIKYPRELADCMGKNMVAQYFFKILITGRGKGSCKNSL